VVETVFNSSTALRFRCWTFTLELSVILWNQTHRKSNLLFWISKSNLFNQECHCAPIFTNDTAIISVTLDWTDCLALIPLDRNLPDLSTLFL
jgi:hypothetical protein